MTAGIATLVCSICSEPSHDICVYCTKDACSNHRCDRCKRCSDCCECDVPLSAAEAAPVEPPPLEVPPAEVPMVAEEPALVQDPEMSIFAPETERTEPSEETKSGDVFRP
jgi:hypothetical protein